MQHAQKIWWSSVMRFSSYASGQTDKRTTKQTYSSQYCAPLRFYCAPCVFLSSDETRQTVVLDYSIWWMFAFVLEGFGIHVSIRLKVTSLQICHLTCWWKIFLNRWTFGDGCEMVDCVALDFRPQRCRTRQKRKITCAWQTETVTNCCYVNRQFNVSLLSTNIKLL